MSPTQAANTMRAARNLVASGQLKAAQLAVLDYLLWRARRPGTREACVSLTTMQRNLHLRRAALVEAVAVLEGHGLLVKLRTRARVLWRGMWAWRQATNRYLFSLAVPEFRGRTTIREGSLEKTHQGAPRPGDAPGQGLQDALARLGAALSPASPLPGAAPRSACSTSPG